MRVSQSGQVEMKIGYLYSIYNTYNLVLKWAWHCSTVGLVLSLQFPNQFQTILMVFFNKSAKYWATTVKLYENMVTNFNVYDSLYL